LNVRRQDTIGPDIPELNAIAAHGEADEMRTRGGKSRTPALWDRMNIEIEVCERRQRQ
jgi:hypothetical protein